MKTYLKMQNEVKDKLSITGLTSSFYTDGTSVTSYIKEAIQEAYEMISSFADWLQLERALTATITSGQEYYNYPTSPFTFKTNGITRIEFNGNKYDKTELNDYRDFKLDNPNEVNTFIFCESQRIFFLFPTPTVSLSADIWGIIVPAPLSGDTDTSVFYQQEPELDVAIVKYATATAFDKANQKNLAQAERAEAMAICQQVWTRQISRKKIVKIQRQSFNEQDMFCTGNHTSTGKFTI